MLALRSLTSLSPHILRLPRIHPARFLSQMAAPTNGAQNGTAKSSHASGPIPFSSRLKEGRALAQDVWSIFK